MKKFIAFLFAVCASVSALAASPTVVEGSVHFLQHSPKGVVITYGLKDYPAIVTFDIKTNGVSIGVEKLTDVTGDVNALVDKAEGRIKWIPGENEKALKGVTATVTAYPVSAPPDYLVVDLRTGSHNYYVSSNAVPLGVTADVYKTDKLVLRRIHARNVTWRMGSPTDEANREARDAGSETPRMVSFSSDYFMSIYPLTVRQQKNVHNVAYRTAAPTAVSENDKKPADCAYEDLRGCNWPTDGHDKVGSQSTCGILRAASYANIDFDLPTSAQWEFACRAGTTGSTYFNGDLDKIAWTGRNAENSLHPVGLLMPNAWGLYDMLGNKMEFVLDKRIASQVLSGDPQLDPWGPTTGDGNNRRILRGGSYADGWGENDNRSAWSYFTGANQCDGYRGGRLCCPVSLKFD